MKINYEGVTVSGTTNHMAVPPESTKTSLRQRLLARARERWPQLDDLTIRHYGAFALHHRSPSRRHDDAAIPVALQRIRYYGGFTIYHASRASYEDYILPSGYLAGTPQEALDCACGLYLNDPTAWQPPTN